MQVESILDNPSAFVPDGLVRLSSVYPNNNTGTLWLSYRNDLFVFQVSQEKSNPEFSLDPELKENVRSESLYPFGTQE